LAAAEGPGADSREALALRSELGAGLFDSGEPSEAGGASALLKEASAELDGPGPGVPEPLNAKCRLDRRLAGFSSQGRAPWLGIPAPPPGEFAEALELFREAASLASPGPEGDAARFSNRSGAAAALILLGRTGEAMPDLRLPPVGGIPFRPMATPSFMEHSIS
jgi:hypothetical protein